MERRRRRRYAATGVVLLVLALVAAGWTLHERRARDTDADLQRGGRDLRSQVRAFERLEGELPTGIRLRSGSWQLSGGREERGGTADVAEGTTVTWYRDTPDPRIAQGGDLAAPGYAFCLAREGRTLYVGVTRSGVAYTSRDEDDGPCATATATSRAD